MSPVISAAARSMEYHARHDQPTGELHHFARIATESAKKHGFISHDEARRASAAHRAGNRAKHGCSAAVRSDPVFVIDPWASYRPGSHARTPGQVHPTEHMVLSMRRRLRGPSATWLLLRTSSVAPVDFALLGKHWLQLRTPQSLHCLVPLRLCARVWPSGPYPRPLPPCRSKVSPGLVTCMAPNPINS